jgi:Arc/MetJ-type ribon-helix-helix transcriptional regulator
LTDIVARTPVETAVEPEAKTSESSIGSESKVETPFKDYEQSKGYPFSVDYFNLGDTWADTSGGFPKEVSLIEEYLDSKVQSGELPNSTDAVKDMLKKMEKVTNLDKHERPLVKIETIAAYIEFLMKTDKIKFNLRRYGK